MDSVSVAAEGAVGADLRERSGGVRRLADG